MHSARLGIPLLAVVLAMTAPALAGEKYALVVGVEKYIPTELPALDYAEDDALAVARALERLGFSVITMTSVSDNPRHRSTTAARIMEQVQGRLDDRALTDTIVLAFSGHGLQFKGDREFYFCPGEAELRDRSTLVPMSRVLEAVGQCRAGRKLLLVDACRDELAPEAAGKGVAIELDPAGVFRAEPPVGTVALFSCQPREKSYELKRLGHSVFTHHVVEYLTGAAVADRYPRQEVSVEELVTFVRNRTRETAAKELGANQKPEALAPDASIPDWPLGSLADLASVERKPAVPRPSEDRPRAAGPSRPATVPEPVSESPAQPSTLTALSLVGRAVSQGEDYFQYEEITNAIARFSQRDLDGCRAVLERVKSYDPKLPPPHVMMAMLWLYVEQLDSAVAELNDAVVKFPGDPEAHLMLADLAFQDRRIADAAAMFDKATVLTAAFTENPKRKRDFEIRCSAGSAAVAEARKQWEVAQKYLAKWLEFDPDNANAHFRMGSVLFQLGKENEALVAFRDARRCDEKAAQPELMMARLYDDARKKGMAKKLIEQAVKAAPKDPAVLLAAAQWYLGQNDLETAKATADAVLKLDAKSLEGRIVRGAIARVDRDYKTAERFFNEAHVQAPENFAASNSLALVLIESTTTKARQQALEIAEGNVAAQREGAPQQVVARETLAWVYYRLGRRDDAERIIDRISRNNALTTDGAYYAARILSDRGEKNRARQILEEVLANEPMFATRPDAVDLLAKLRQNGL